MAEIDVDREVARAADQVDRTAARAREQFERVGPIVGRAEAPDGALSVEVEPGGLLSEVQLSSRALRSGSEAVAEQIMGLAARATRRAGDQMYHALAPVLGPGAQQRLASLGYEPIPEDDEDAPGMDGR